MNKIILEGNGQMTSFPSSDRNPWMNNLVVGLFTDIIEIKIPEMKQHFIKALKI